MTATYDKRGIQFLYPDNWTLQDEMQAEIPFDVSLETPTGGMWTLSVFPAQTDLDRLLKDTVGQLDQQYESLEVTPFATTLESHSASGFEAFFYCLDLLITARICAVDTGKFSFLILTQAENREYQNIHEVFEAVTISLLKPNFQQPVKTRRWRHLEQYPDSLKM